MRRTVAAILGAAALAGCGPSPSHQETPQIPASDPQTACILNMRILDLATEQCALAGNLNLGEQAQQTQLAGYISKDSGSTNCPAGGTYAYGVVGKDPECSIHGAMPKR